MAKRPSRRHAASDSELQRSSGGILNADAVDADATLNLGSVLDREKTVVNTPGSTHNSGVNFYIDNRGRKRGRNKESSGGDS